MLSFKICHISKKKKACFAGSICPITKIIDLKSKRLCNSPLPLGNKCFLSLPKKKKFVLTGLEQQLPCKNTGSKGYDQVSNKPKAIAVVLPS